jgi:DNA-binding beta-propeller fold protein YncE
MTARSTCLRRTALAAAIALLTIPAARASIIYASNFGNNTITAYDPLTGMLLGTAVTAGPEASGFNGLRVDSFGNFLVAGQYTNNVVRYSPAGALLETLDPANTAGLSSPQDLAIGPDGKLYVVSSANDRILRYDPSTGAFLDTFATLGVSGHVGPVGLAFGPNGDLFVTGFDNDVVVRLDGTTGAVLATTQGPPGLGFGPAAFGPDGGLYIASLDLSTFAGAVFRYDVNSTLLTNFILPGSGGLQSPGGIAFFGDSLLFSNLVFDFDFNDTGSTILRYNAAGAPLATLVPPGRGLNIPFFLATSGESGVPESSPAAMIALGIVAGVLLLRRSV